MANSIFVITGTSRGIGEALAKTLLKDGHEVYGVSRGTSDGLSQYKNYTHIHYDLSNTEGIERLLTDIFARVDLKEKELVCLINNAAMLDPLKSIEECLVEEMTKNLQISLLAPILLSASFIRQTRTLTTRRKIVNISSGAGTHPLQDMSMYCTAKAGLNMFTRCIGAEQAENQNQVEIIAVDPGMVETEMQRMARGRNAEDFTLSGFFKEAYENGELLSPEEIAENLKYIIGKKHKTGSIMNHFEK